MKYLCLILDKDSGEELLAFTDIEAIDLYFALHKARKKFEELTKHTPRLRKIKNWYVDGVEVES